MKRYIKAILLFVFGGALAALAVANRHSVKFVADPFIDRDAAFTLELPLFVYLFTAMFAGLIIGGLTVWFGQAYWRKTARRERKEAAVWKREAETLKRGLQSVTGPQGSSQTQALRIS